VETHEHGSVEGSLPAKGESLPCAVMGCVKPNSKSEVSPVATQRPLPPPLRLALTRNLPFSFLTFGGLRRLYVIQVDVGDVNILGLELATETGTVAQ